VLSVVATGLCAAVLGIVVWRCVTDRIAERVAEEERSILFRGALIGAAGCLGAEVLSSVLFPKLPKQPQPQHRSVDAAQRHAKQMAEMFWQFHKRRQEQRGGTTSYT